MLTTDRKGAIAELAIMSEALRLGVDVSDLVSKAAGMT